jgi:hypothetical protein
VGSLGSQGFPTPFSAPRPSIWGTLTFYAKGKPHLATLPVETLTIGDGGFNLTVNTLDKTFGGGPMYVRWDAPDGTTIKTQEIPVQLVKSRQSYQIHMRSQDN